MQKIALSIIFIFALTAAVAVGSHTALAFAPQLPAIDFGNWSHIGTAATVLAAVAATDTRSSFTVQEFCQRNGISKSFFYKLKNMGKGPRLMNVGTHSRISLEAEADWKRNREADASYSA